MSLNKDLLNHAIELALKAEKKTNTQKYFCDGPEGHFYCDDLEMARKLVSLIDQDDDWTITELPLKSVDAE